MQIKTYVFNAAESTKMRKLLQYISGCIMLELHKYKDIVRNLGEIAINKQCAEKDVEKKWF